MAAATPTPRRWTLPCWWKGHRAHRTGYTQRALPTFPSYSLSKPALQPQPHASSLELPACTCGPSRRTALLHAPSAPCHESCTSSHRFALLSPCSPPPPHSPFAGPPGLRPAQVRPIHSASSPVPQPRPSLQPSCPAENSNPVDERKYQGLCPACAATTAAPLCTASHPLLRRAVPIDRGRTATCTRRRRRR